MYDLTQAYPKIEKQKAKNKAIDKRGAYSALIKGFLRIPINEIKRHISENTDLHPSPEKIM